MKEKMCELAVIMADLENTIKDMYSKKEWLSVEEFASMLHMCGVSVSTLKDRPAFKPFVKFTVRNGCRIKNCPEAFNLMRSYKDRDFEYEQEFLKKQKASR